MAAYARHLRPGEVIDPCCGPRSVSHGMHCKTLFIVLEICILTKTSTCWAPTGLVPEDLDLLIPIVFIHHLPNLLKSLYHAISHLVAAPFFLPHQQSFSTCVLASPVRLTLHTSCDPGPFWNHSRVCYPSTPLLKLWSMVRCEACVLRPWFMERRMHIFHARGPSSCKSIRPFARAFLEDRVCMECLVVVG